MTYDSLLLNYGGGIISASKQSKQYGGAAAVAIGIGGTGVAALAELKRKVYQQLEPDNPGEPVPHYDHIQFLAIDSDETEIDGMHGKARLNKGSEFFSVSNPQLKAALGGKDVIKNNPTLNWMEIDRINSLLSPMGAGGIRQVGRYLLLSKAAALKLKIEEKCTTALKGLQKPALDIYIFAGISGGTGSGCFLDTCYIVRKAMEERGWSSFGNIMGFFFLPDVVTSKPEVAAVTSYVDYNHSNGYAAMKELDYLMDLKGGNDFFSQNYGSFSIHTQEPPVDMCHLISATQADGKVLPNGFLYGIHVASDYVMAYLADVEMGNSKAGEDDKGLTMRGHLANVTQGVAGLSRNHGAHLSYHVLGASNAEIPMTQIATYLAAGFYQRFQNCIGRDKVVITKPIVDEWVQKLGLSINQVYNELVRNCDPLFLPEIERKELASYGIVQKGKAPKPWADPGNAWIDHCFGKRTQNRKALNGALGSFDPDKASSDSLVGRVFRKLCELCTDPEYGPYYAASLLSHQGYDLMSALDGAIRQAQEEKATQELQLRGNGSGGYDEYVMQCSSDFYHHTSKKNYQRYVEAVQQWYLIYNRYNECDDLATTLRNLKNELSALYQSFFVPLINLLDDLNETFVADIRYLNSDAAAAPAAYTWRILELKDVRSKLDEVIENLAVNELVNKFIAYILKGYSQWQTGDDGKIGQYISRYMEDVFQSQVNRSLEDYLMDVYPQAGGNIDQLAEEIERDIIHRIHQSALPMFWCNPTFALDNPAVTFQASSISVPRSTIAVCNAADSFKKSHSEYVVRKTSLKDRIFALRFFSGVPFYAYQGITLLKGAYDQAAANTSGVGSHLYAYTGRGEDGSGLKDWRNFLPVPAPYSKEKTLLTGCEEALALYDAGEQAGIIRVNEQKNYVILKTNPVEVQHYTTDDFIQQDVFQRGVLTKCREELKRQLEDIHKPGMGQAEVLLKNDGDPKLGEKVVLRVRKDYFIHYPKLQELVRDELNKRAMLQAGIDTLDAIEHEYDQYDTELGFFTDLLFYRVLSCINASGNPCYYVKNGQGYHEKIFRILYTYTDSRGMDKDLIFSQDEEEMKYAKDYPLYQAFCTYRSLSPEEQPRQELDELIRERRKALLQPGDNIIGYILEQEWDKQAINKLHKVISSLPEEERKDLSRFYLGLVRCIAQFHEKFTEEEWRNLNDPNAKDAPAAEPKVWTVSDGSRYLYVYENNNPNFGWDQNAGQWVPLTTSMYVWNPDSNSWLPVTSDPTGKIKLP
ncbi:hypothetical protein H7U37_11700 [Pseudoflavonifractor phocaeensis]|uniref:tubulin-like doman-containing protein n=3 Tax=Pseudoflavonifractor phocaeensis TaxID=1870988 RepID=UPI00195DB7F2|nr:tubulin-like doman-containing protein [Pseudoflavonifractor phocaeensis]MBM6939177.1 hypothetical protein [Pseudoflavonifractor phocaeensis]